MDSEMRSQKENDSWRLVKRPQITSVLRNRWVYKIKTDNDEQVTRLKARLVVKGFSQVPGVDYSETFSPVCRYKTVKSHVIRRDSL